jgi:chromosome partitioning protein
MDAVLTTDQVAERLRCDRKTVLRWIHAGKLRAAKIGRDYRVLESEVTRLLAPPEAKRPTSVCRVTALVNQKGGVAKSTSCLNLGVALARQGRRVLLVDMDPQGGLTACAGIPASLKLTVYNALLDPETDPVDALQQVAENLDLLPANIDLSGAEIELINEISREMVLRRVLDRLRDRYDHVLVDCPPSLGLLTIAALAASHRVLIPVHCSYLSWRGLPLLRKTLAKVRATINPDLSVFGILPTMFDTRTAHHHEALGALKQQYPTEVLDIVVKSSVRVQDAAKAGVSIFDLDPRGDVAASYWRLAEEVDRG